jgi:hypothetical protein|tara:strand:- start:402 stop:668 length:267 start_codon:yes stop_codon:yes gene_type:complete
MRNILLETGDVVATSIRGSKGFYYPDFSSGPIKINKSCAGYPMIWLKQMGFHAFSIPITSINDNKYGISNKPYIVIWVSETLMKKRSN